MRTLLTTLVTLSLALAGCMGDGENVNEQLRKAAAQVDEQTGGVQGVVTDVAVMPLSGIEVRLVELDEVATSEDDGSFAFSLIPPGTYTVEASPPEFVPHAATVEVVANAVATTDILLQPLATQAAFSEVFELKGFIECGIGSGAQGVGGVSFAACNVPNAAQEGSTNDRFIHFFQLQPPVQDVVLEVVWDNRGNPGADRLWIAFEREGCGLECPGDQTLWEEIGDSPLQGKVDVEGFQALDQWWIDSCEAGSTQFCGMSPWDLGWPLQIRAFADPYCLGPGGVCPYVQQDFTVYLTAFYNQAAPEGYTALDGTFASGE